ncbi:MAG TPA: hypothetical protein VF173_38585 [Thermoanaerobaculia bacterium]|nr:hypothetical protein [Thermoanaerobaculia bacterium]
MSTNEYGWTCPDDPSVLEKADVCLRALSKDLDGVMNPQNIRPHICQDPGCQTLTTVHDLEMSVKMHLPCDDPEWGPVFDGSFTVQKLVTIFDKDDMGRGLHAGDFLWTGAGVQVTGRISGMTNVGTHREPAFFPACQQCDTREVMEGRLCGSVVKANDSKLENSQVFGAYRIHFYAASVSSDVKGTFEGVLVRPCVQE